jgi:hypothetical protein
MWYAEQETDMAILLDKAFVNLIAHKLEDGEWQQAIRTMVTNRLDGNQVYDLLNKINYYSGEDFDIYLREQLAARKNKEALDGFFSKVNI